MKYQSVSSGGGEYQVLRSKRFHFSRRQQSLHKNFVGAGPGRWALALMLSLSCSTSRAQVEPQAGNWKTWVLTGGNQLRLPPPPNEAETRAEIAQLKEIAKYRDAAVLER